MDVIFKPSFVCDYRLVSRASSLKPTLHREDGPEDFGGAHESAIINKNAFRK